MLTLLVCLCSRSLKVQKRLAALWSRSHLTHNHKTSFKFVSPTTPLGVSGLKPLLQMESNYIVPFRQAPDLEASYLFTFPKPRQAPQILVRRPSHAR